MGFAKGNPLLYQIVGEISRHHAARERGAHSPGVEPNLLERPGYSREHEQNRVNRVEQHALVVLQILVIAVGQSFEGRQKRRQITDGART